MDSNHIFVYLCISLFSFVYIAAGSEVTIFNQDGNSEDDSVQSLMEIDHLIKVTKKAKAKKGNSSEIKEKFANASNFKTTSNADPTSSKTSDAKKVVSTKEVKKDTKQQNRTVAQNRMKETDTKMKKLDYETEINEFQEDDWLLDDIFTPFDKGPLLERSKRQLQAGSGQEVFKGVLILDGVLDGDNSFEADVTTALNALFESFFTGTFVVRVTSITNGSIIVEFEILFSTDESSVASISTTLSQTTSLTINNITYSVLGSKGGLSSDSTLADTACFSCQSYETCIQKSTYVFECKLSDPDFYPYGEDQGDLKMERGVEDVTATVFIEGGFAYEQSIEDTFYISVNGLISIGTKFTSDSPRRLPVGGKQLLAAFWTNLEIDVNDTSSNVFYKHYQKGAANTTTVIERANAQIVEHNEESISSFDASDVIVVTWNNVKPENSLSGQLENATFQCVIALDGEVTYLSYIYAEGAMRIEPQSNRAIQIGWGSRNLGTVASYYKFDTIIGNTGILGYWVFQIGNRPNSAAQCLKWYRSNLVDLEEIERNNDRVPPCPCNYFAAAISGFWIPSVFSPFCFDSFPRFGISSRRCCYRLPFGSLGIENRRPFSGSFQKYTPFFGNLANHIQSDVTPKTRCCFQSSYCNLYYIVRPTRQCINTFTFRSFFFGDPHIKTPDNREYMFNGLGEYVLMKIDGTRVSDNTYVDFVLQGRTCRAVNKDGNLTDATIWCGLGSNDTAGNKVFVELSSDKQYLIVYINGIDYSAQTRSSGYSEIVNGMSIRNVNGSLRVTTPADIGYTVSITSQLLDFSVEIDQGFQGMMTGLLGNFNGDKTDDFIFPNGTQLPDNASDRELFKYGQTWAVTEQTTILRYETGQNVSTSSDANFVPLFLDEANATTKAEAANVCGSDTAYACIFDFIATKNAELAQNTQQSVTTFEDEERTINNEAPNITLGVTIQTQVNQAALFSFVASDPENDTVQYVIIDRPSGFTFNETSGELQGSFTPTSLDPVLISVAANDSTGLESEISTVTIINCDCSDNGVCNYTNAVSTTNAYYSVATCNCGAPFSGEQCQDDKDGCSSEPCPSGTNCTDIPATEEAHTGIAYNCSDCPAGYTLTNTANKFCQDIDECAANPMKCGSNAVCTNNVGSFVCVCNSGYQKDASNQCIDINECEENSHKCQQICTNIDGSYECSCESGYTLEAVFALNCTKNEGAANPCENTKNCSYGCTNKTGVPTCFCASGFSLSADEVSCENVNECMENLCSQRCTDNVGSYVCSCYTGYTLSSNGHSCDVCPDGFFGENCAQECQCRGRATSCDNVQGCVCVPQWTGANCLIDVNECTTQSNACPEQQICENLNGSYRCNCPNGYENTYNNGTCYDIDECNIPSTNCPQSCVNNPGSYTCTCTPGYTYNSTSNTCIDIDECALEISGCTQICVNMIGSFNCECQPGYILEQDRKTCQEVSNFCAGQNLNCSYACTVIDNKATCFCEIGFLLGSDNRTCIDVNECGQPNDCSDTCNNNAGSYTCTCPAGKKLQNNKRTCTDCDEYHWGVECANQCDCYPIGTQECDKVTGCVCKAGWRGTDCKDDLNECEGATSPCPNRSTCTNAPGSFICTCDTGYTREGDTCNNTNECLSNPCDQTCTDTDGSYTCTCSTGFIVNGDKCDDIDECLRSSDNDCDQLCRNSIGGYSCYCYDGFVLNTTTRNTCIAESVASCLFNNTCGNFCRIVGGQENCFCESGFKLDGGGQNCIDILECAAGVNPCQYPNLCEERSGSFACGCPNGTRLLSNGISCENCPTGSYGPNCASSCSCITANTQTCEPADGTCTCKTGFNGTNCENDIDECDQSPCPSFSTCTDKPGSYQCTCQVGYFSSNNLCKPCDGATFGQNCESRCLCELANTADCNSIDGSCTCNQGWTGETCTTDINECNNGSYCSGKANSQCANQDGTASCDCISGYSEVDGVCNDQNECLLNTDNCTTAQDCENRPGSFACLCKIGTSGPNANNECTPCDSTHYGTNCVQTCDCIASNTRDCDDVNGDCTCNDGWTSSTCAQDIDECTVNADACPGLNATCVNTNGSFECQCAAGYTNTSQGCAISDAEKDSNLELILGLGVGVPVFFVLVLVIAIAVFIYVKRKSSGRTSSDTPSEDRNAPFRSVFAGQVATKGSWGAPHRFQSYAPDAYSEAGTSDSSNDGQLVKSRQKGRSDFQDSPWYDNRGATPRAESRAPTEAGATTSNFSWEYMFNLLQPHKGVEIPRPNVSPTPNPTYTPRSGATSGRRFDSLA